MIRQASHGHPHLCWLLHRSASDTPQAIPDKALVEDDADVVPAGPQPRRSSFTLHSDLAASVPKTYAPG